jgi:hypothetical protein
VFPLVSSPLREEDFPEVSFWTREKWTTREKADNSISNGEKVGERGGSKMAKGINISMQYVEDKHGVLIDGFRVKMILGAAHQLFFQLREVRRHPQDMGHCWNGNSPGLLSRNGDAIPRISPLRQ